MLHREVGAAVSYCDKLGWHNIFYPIIVKFRYKARIETGHSPEINLMQLPGREGHANLALSWPPTLKLTHAQKLSQNSVAIPAKE